MKRKAKILIPLWLLVIIITWYILYTQSSNPIQTTKTPQVCINKTCFDIEIAKTPKQRQIGLMYRKNMPELSGMLFVFQQSGQYNFWMKNTLIPLDMVRINDQLEIIDIKQAIPCTQDPCPSYNPQWISSYVLELNSWVSQKYWIKIWDKVKINY